MPTCLSTSLQASYSSLVIWVTGGRFQAAHTSRKWMSWP